MYDIIVYMPLLRSVNMVPLQVDQVPYMEMLQAVPQTAQVFPLSADHASDLPTVRAVRTGQASAHQTTQVCTLDTAIGTAPCTAQVCTLDTAQGATLQTAQVCAIDTVQGTAPQSATFCTLDTAQVSAPQTARVSVSLTDRAASEVGHR